MAGLEISEVREVDAPVEVAWQTASDTSRYAEWVPVTLEVVRTDGPAHLGATYEERDKALGPFKSSSSWTVVEYDEPRRQVHRTESVPILKPLEVIIELESIDASRSRFVLTWRGRTALGPVGALMVRLQRSGFERDLATTADNMQAAFEAAAAAVRPR